MENAVKDGMTYEAEAVVLPVKCTGLVKVSYLLKLFAKGVRGVLVLGCDEGDCRYYNGSARCAEIVDETREILSLAGIARDRLQFHLIAESGGREVKRVLKSFLKQFGKMAADRAKRDGGGKPKAKRPKAVKKAKVVRKPKPAAKKASRKKKAPSKPKAKKPKPAGRKPKPDGKQRKPGGKKRKPAKAGRTTAGRKTTGGTRKLKARKGTKRGSSRRRK
jgi:coenzyme F420-reducing hydrogenase delta subunit